MGWQGNPAAGRWPGAVALLLLGLMPSASHLKPPQEAAGGGYSSLFDGDTSAAVLELRSVLTGNPAFPYHWSDLGTALADAGDQQAAGYCYSRSVELAPGDPQIALRAMNFQFRSGHNEAALPLGARVLRLVPDYDSVVFHSYLRMNASAESIRRNGIGSNQRAAVAFFGFLHNYSPGVSLVPWWDWIDNAGYADPSVAGLYAQWLMTQKQPAAAAGVWREYAALDRSAYQSDDFIDNGGFEREPGGGAFDWVLQPHPAVIATRSAERYRTGAHSLKLTFSGQENIEYRHVSQLVWLVPGTYRLSAWIHTESLSTDEGIAIGLTSTGNDPLSITTPALTGDRDWTEVTAGFEMTGRPRLAQVVVLRHRSLDFDNKLRGTAWIDDVTLKPVGVKPAKAPAVPVPPPAGRLAPTGQPRL